MTLHDALLDIALSEGVSLIFEPSNVPDIKVRPFTKEMPLKQKMAILLAGTSLQYEFKNDQIFLYKERTIYGYIEDGDTGERLISATFTIPSEGLYDVSNEHGYFSISTIKDSVDIEASYIGYADTKIKVMKGQMDRPIIIKLYVDNSFDEIVITDALATKDERDFIELDKGSDILLHQNQAISAVGGEPDIFQAMIRQSGVNAGTDGLGGIHVRGGRNDQNLILYDGVKLYNSAHAFGLFSIINNSVIDQARLYKSGSNGALTGRLSSIMDIKIKDPSLDRFHSNVQISTLASQATVEGPIIKNKLGISLTGRRTHVDPFIKSLSDKSGDDLFRSGHINYNFSDFNLKMYGKLDKKSRLYLTLYKGNDHYTSTENFASSDEIGALNTFDDNTLYNWENELASLRYNTLIGNSSFLNVILSAYKYGYNNQLEFNQVDSFDLYAPEYQRKFSKFNSGITSYDLKIQAETVLKNHEIKYGASLGRKNFIVGILDFEDVDSFSSTPYPLDIPITTNSSGNYIAREATIHIADKFKVSKSLLFDAGLYYTYIDSKDIDYENELASNQAIHGYIKALLRLGKNLNVGGSIGKYIQTEHLLTAGDNGYPNDIWLPSTLYTPPEQSWQYEIFTQFKFDNHSVNLSAYYKTQDGLIWTDSIAALPSLSDFVNYLWEFETIIGSANGYGAEFDYSYHLPDQLTLRGIYTYGKTDHTFFELNYGEPFPYDFSILHTVSLGLNAKIHPKINLSVDWYYASGKPNTYYEFYPELDKEPTLSPLDKESGVTLFAIDETLNSGRLAPSHKLSFSLSTYWNWGKVRSDLSLGVQNLYGRKNELFSYSVYDADIDQVLPKAQTGFPLLPMFKWKISI